MERDITEQFAEDGFIVVRQLLAPDEVAEYIARLKALAYGVENLHFRNHWHYYLNLRKDLGYAGLDPALASELRAANLLASPPPAGLEIEGAWIPSSTFTYVAKKFK